MIEIGRMSPYLKANFQPAIMVLAERPLCPILPGHGSIFMDEEGGQAEHQIAQFLSCISQCLGFS